METNIHDSRLFGELAELALHASQIFRQLEQLHKTSISQNPLRDLPFFVPDKLEELGTYTLEQFATMYRNATEGDGKQLAAFLKKYEQLGVLDFNGFEKKEILSVLQGFFPTMKKYTYNNFVFYF